MIRENFGFLQFADFGRFFKKGIQKGIQNFFKLVAVFRPFLPRLTALKLHLRPI